MSERMDSAKRRGKRMAAAAQEEKRRHAKGNAMSEHAAGPWECGESNVCTLDGLRVHRFPIFAHGQAIASVWNGSVGKEALRFGNQEANARLIAAAPDLLAALRDLADAVKWRHRDADLDRAHNAAAALLAKHVPKVTA